MGDEKKRAVVLELSAQDVQAGLDNAVSEKRQLIVRFTEGLWDKYRMPLICLQKQRGDVEVSLSEFVKRMAYL